MWIITAVAAATAYAITVTRPDGKDYGNLQTAYMAPTEILAKQHFASFIEFFKKIGRASCRERVSSPV